MSFFSWLRHLRVWCMGRADRRRAGIPTPPQTLRRRLSVEALETREAPTSLLSALVGELALPFWAGALVRTLAGGDFELPALGNGGQARFGQVKHQTLSHAPLSLFSDPWWSHPEKTYPGNVNSPPTKTAAPARTDDFGRAAGLIDPLINPLGGLNLDSLINNLARANGSKEAGQPLGGGGSAPPLTSTPPPGSGFGSGEPAPIASGGGSSSGESFNNPAGVNPSLGVDPGQFSGNQTQDDSSAAQTAVPVSSQPLAAFSAPVITLPTQWIDLGIVYSGSGDAYYPSVIYDANGFGGGSPQYKMWYSDGSGKVFVTPSQNGIAWGSATEVAGLGGDAHHVQVVYGGPNAPYQIWYWDIDADLYSISAMATAVSNNGINWTGDTSLTQSLTSPLVMGDIDPNTIAWNRGTYGPVDVSFENGQFRMYYNGHEGAHEFTGLAHSPDGVFWEADSPSPVLAGSSHPAWDCSDVVYGTVLQDADGYHYWYSGGGGGDGGCADHPVHEGIGYASSSDGLSWTKDPNPIFHISDGVSYRNQRVYTPEVVDDGSGYLKMYYSAQGTGGPKQIGLAVQPSPPVASPDEYFFVENNPLTVSPNFGVLANDFDYQNKPLTAELFGLPSYGYVSLNGDGSFSYNPFPGLAPEDFFTYRAVAGGVASAVVQVIIKRLRFTITNPIDSNNNRIIDDPATGNLRRGNEFTFSSAAPGVLTIPVRIQITPDTTRVRSIFLNMIKVELSPIADSHGARAITNLGWNNFLPDEPTAGRAVYNADLQRWMATATFTGLPRNNNDFGKKTAKVTIFNPYAPLALPPFFFQGSFDFEVFFPRDATNHPDLPGMPDLGNFSATNEDTGRGNSTRSPNWFFYWMQTGAATGVVPVTPRFDSTTPAIATFVGTTPAQFDWWNYAGPRDRVLLGPRAALEFQSRALGDRRWRTGIDMFNMAIRHESLHVQQVLEHNALNPLNRVAQGLLRSGWSWANRGIRILKTPANIRSGAYNHFGVGDIDLDPDGDGISAAAGITNPDPNPNLFQPNLIEIQAHQVETNAQDGFRLVDWSAPGKQHGPDRGPQARHFGETNYYNDWGRNWIRG